MSSIGCPNDYTFILDTQCIHNNPKIEMCTIRGYKNTLECNNTCHTSHSLLTMIPALTTYSVEYNLLFPPSFPFPFPSSLSNVCDVTSYFLLLPFPLLHSNWRLQWNQLSPWNRSRDQFTFRSYWRYCGSHFNSSSNGCCNDYGITTDNCMSKKK